MSVEKIAVIFPAFGMAYRKFDMARLPGYRRILTELLREASQIVPIDTDEFIRGTCSSKIGEQVDDFQKHYLCFINSCALSRYLKRNLRSDHIAAGYSMGLFAALYHADCVSFEHGLKLMHHVCRSAHEASSPTENHGMGMIAGLSLKTVEQLISGRRLEVEVADVTLENLIITSGKESQLQLLFEEARKSGALQTKLLPVALPYHSSMMHEAGQKIRDFLDHIEINDPIYRLVSCCDQQVMTRADDIRREVAGNVVNNINWYATMNRLLKLGVTIFLECGVSEGLCKLSKFFPGDFTAYHPKKYYKYFGTARAN